jgi:hypothetical protein
VGFSTTFVNFNVIKPFFYVIGSYWVAFEPNFLEEVGDGQLTSQLFNQGQFEAMGIAFESIQSRYAEEKPSQIQFEAEKPLRRRCCRTISESFGCPFRVSFLCMVPDIWENMNRSVL